MFLSSLFSVYFTKVIIQTISFKLSYEETVPTFFLNYQEPSPENLNEAGEDQAPTRNELILVISVSEVTNKRWGLE